jgi:hypothetical protein
MNFGRVWCDVSSSVLLHKAKKVYFFTLACCVLCDLCESVLALECCKSWGVAGVKATSPV